jgi:hypothetical protein
MVNCNKCGKKLGFFDSKYKIENDKANRILSPEENDEILCNNCFEDFKEKQSKKNIQTKNQRIKKKSEEFSDFALDEDKQIKSRYVKIINPVILGMWFTLGMFFMLILIFIVLLFIQAVIGVSLIQYFIKVIL